MCHVRSVFVDDRINTAGFGSEIADIAPSSLVMPKTTGENYTQEDLVNATYVEVLDDILSDTATATESHIEDLNFPTVLPDTGNVEIPTNDSSALTDEAKLAVQGDQIAVFRTF